MPSIMLEAVSKSGALTSWFLSYLRSSDYKRCGIIIATLFATSLFLNKDTSSYFNKYLKFSHNTTSTSFLIHFSFLLPEYPTVSN